MAKTGFVFLAGIAWAWFAMLGPAMAAPVQKPPELAGVIHATKPYGSGSISWLFITAYDAILWTDAQNWSYAKPFALSLRYHMSFSSKEIVDRTIKEMHKVAPDVSAQRLAHIRAMLGPLFPSVTNGDVITALYRPGEPTAFFKNGNPLGVSDDTGFAKPFFDIWLSPKTSERHLRKKLLHLN